MVIADVWEIILSNYSFIVTLNVYRIRLVYLLLRKVVFFLVNLSKMTVGVKKFQINMIIMLQ
jgi:hypothetical protein